MADRPLITPESAERLAGMVRMAPARDLADIVEQHWVVAWDNRGREPVVQEVLPDPSVNLAVEPAGVLLYGVTSRRSRHVLADAGRVVGTKFRPGGFSGFHPGPVSELADRIVPLPDLERELAGAPGTRRVIEIVSDYLRARRPPPDPQRALVADIVAAMRAAEPGTRVADVAAQFGLTSRTLQRLFATHVGAGPKRVLQRLRLQQAADRLAAADGDLARLAVDLGYFDQAHFAHDFRAATGRRPSQAAAARPG